MPRLRPAQYVLNGVEFGHLGVEDIRALSVAQITEQSTMDEDQKPADGGLYDLRLGSFQNDHCATCHKSSWHCHGHLGHINLPIACYHPLFFDQILRLLRAQCVYCQRLKLSKVEINRYVCMLRLLQHGLIQEMLALENMHIKNVHRDGVAPIPSGLLSPPSGSDSDGVDVRMELEPEDGIEEDPEEFMKRRNRFVRICVRRARTQREGEPLVNFKNTIGAGERRRVIRDFLGDIAKAKKCTYCLGESPGVRKENFTKLYRKQLAEKAKARMMQGGFDIPDPVVLIQEKRELQKAMARGEKLHGAEDEIARAKAVRAEAQHTDIEGQFDAKYLSPVEVYASLTLLFKHEQELFDLLYSSRPWSKGHPVAAADMFFIKALLVPPNRFRPESTGDDGKMTEDPQNSIFVQILRHSDLIRGSRDAMRKGLKTTTQLIRNKTQMTTSIVKLQEFVNQLIDSTKNPSASVVGAASAEGIKQKLEKKEGLFRHNMMGKRVNHAARTVLSPDVYLETNEIGIPRLFAKKLVYPVPVTEVNHAVIKQFVINGFFRYPGATIIEKEDGMVLNLKAKSLDERVAIANKLLTPYTEDSAASKPFIVHRHLISGDWVLMNRQPTLHKPSIMAHKARVFENKHVENVFRMHYTNCSSYNADFDGDEMNLHFPQSSLGQCEASMIASTDQQYLSATSGKPLRGLIQDHISGGTWFTGKDTMFTVEEYMHLLYAALRPEDGHTTYSKILMVKPAIIRPRQMWTGKQVITSILKNITPKELEPLTMIGKSSAPASSWGEESKEGEFVVKQGELICGILDKAQLGAVEGSLISCVHDIYGPIVTGKLIGILGRLFTKFQNMRPFTCGLDDLFLTKEGEFERTKRLKEADQIGLEVHLKYVKLENQKRKKRRERQLRRRLADVFQHEEYQKSLDSLMNSRTAKLSTEITAACMPKRLAKRYPKNGMQTMTISGAKGSQVNANLISCNLGQQVLEGRRVPVMPSGKTLPCYRAFETRPIAGGYIAGRFLSGIKPQEYFFHAMAGREGLIDTAVKTSRSGYLQRCLVKGLEGLRADYDGTVRESDSSIVQFLYGEDGLEVTKARSFTRLPLLAQNYGSIVRSQGSKSWELLNGRYEDIVKENRKAARHWRKARRLDASDPVISKYNPSSQPGSVSEAFFKSITGYLDEDPVQILKSEKNPHGIKKLDFRAIMDLKYMNSLVEPGEAVGVVAAQSVGEPSTQMTLNTFHLAGHSSKNVTLGIPRLREIVMTASAKLKTPVMTLQLIEELTPEDGLLFSRTISKYSLAEFIDSVTFRESSGKGPKGKPSRIYDIHIRFFPAMQYMVEHEVVPDQLATAVQQKFIPDLVGLARKDMRRKRMERAGEIFTEAFPDIGKPIETGNVLLPEEDRHVAPTGGISDNDSDYDQDDDPENDAKAAMRLANRRAAQGYDDPDEEEEEALHELEDPETSSDVESDEDRTSSIRDTSNEQSAKERLSTNHDTDDGESDQEKVPSVRDSNETSSDDETRNSAVGRNFQPVDESVHLAEGDRSPAAIEREKSLLSQCKEVARFRFDEQGGWANVRLTYGIDSLKFLMMPHIETASRRAIVTQTPRLGKCQLIMEEKYDSVTKEKSKYATIATEGVNLDIVREWQHVINPHKIMTNDIVSMLKSYGVEAARATIVSELTSVFQSHGITVDARHLNLIADVMTRGGGFTPFNRTGLKDSSISPLMKMSFETTFGYLKEAVDDQDWDDLKSPSARIITGKADQIGTGAFSLANRVDRVYLKAARAQLEAQSSGAASQSASLSPQAEWEEYDEKLVDEHLKSLAPIIWKGEGIDNDTDVGESSSDETLSADETELNSPLYNDDSTPSSFNEPTSSDSDINLMTSSPEFELDGPECAGLEDDADLSQSTAHSSTDVDTPDTNGGDVEDPLEVCPSPPSSPTLEWWRASSSTEAGDSPLCGPNGDYDGSDEGDMALPPNGINERGDPVEHDVPPVINGIMPHDTTHEQRFGTADDLADDVGSLAHEDAVENRSLSPARDDIARAQQSRNVSSLTQAPARPPQPAGSARWNFSWLYGRQQQ